MRTTSNTLPRPRASIAHADRSMESEPVAGSDAGPLGIVGMTTPPGDVVTGITVTVVTVVPPSGTVVPVVPPPGVVLGKLPGYPK